MVSLSGTWKEGEGNVSGTRIGCIIVDEVGQLCKVLDVLDRP